MYMYMQIHIAEGSRIFSIYIENLKTRRHMYMYTGMSQYYCSMLHVEYLFQ